VTVEDLLNALAHLPYEAEVVVHSDKLEKEYTMESVTGVSKVPLSRVTSRTFIRAGNTSTEKPVPGLLIY